MKSLVIICSFLLIIEIQQIWSHEETRADATSAIDRFIDEGEDVDVPQWTATTGGGGIDRPGIKTYQATWINTPSMVRSNSMPLKGQKTNQQNSKERANKIRENARKDYEAALNKATSAFKDVKAKLRTMSRDSSRELNTQSKIIEHEHQIAIDTADAIWRNTFLKWENMRRNAENEYQQVSSTMNQKVKEAWEKRDATHAAADNQFVKDYTLIEKNKERAANEYREPLAKGQTEYENAVKSAEKRKSQAEKEFSDAANKYKTIPADQWAQVVAKYKAEIEIYNNVLQKANKDWQSVLDEAGLGKQYREALNEAAMQLQYTEKEAAATTSTTITKCDEELQRAEKSKKDTVTLANAGKQKAKKEQTEALDKARKDAKIKVDNIFKNWQKKQALADVEFKKAEAEFQKTKDEATRRFDTAMKQASMVEKNTMK